MIETPGSKNQREFWKIESPQQQRGDEGGGLQVRRRHEDQGRPRGPREAGQGPLLQDLQAQK